MVDKIGILKRFGYPQTLIKEYKHWYLLLRKPQTTLGSLVLMCKDNVDRFSEISEASSLELSSIIPEIEKSLDQLFGYQKINYLMLMMVDSIVHFHIIPRYKKSRHFRDISFNDYSWPDVPDLNKYNKINNEMFNKIVSHICGAVDNSLPPYKYNLVYTTGVFDVFHYGHLNILKKSKELGRYLIVGVSTDELVLEEKSKKPIIPFEERCKILESIQYVDQVIPQVDKNKQKVVDEYQIDVITVGDDWRGKYPHVTCHLEYIPYTPLISSSKIRDKVFEP